MDIAAGEPVRVTLELLPDRQPVEGKLWSAGAEPQPFVGLLDLVRLLDAAVAKPPGETA